MQIIKVDLNDKAEVINLNDYIQVQQGDSAVPVQFVFVYNNDTVDMSDGKLGFINGITAGSHNVELEAPGNGAGQCVINLNSYLFQDAGAFKWLYVGIKDSDDNIITAVNATLTVKASNLDNGINTGDYRSDWQNFKNGLTNDVNKVSSEVNSAAVQASAAASSASAAASSASAAANQADRTMDYLNYEISNKFDDLKKDADNLFAEKSKEIDNNTANINGLKGTFPILLSPNLAINSEFASLKGNPYQDWVSVYGWKYSDNSAVARKGWYGYNALQCQCSQTKYLISDAVNTSLISSENVSNAYSASILYRKSGDNIASNEEISVYLEVAYDISFENSQKFLIGKITTASDYGYSLLKAENISIPANMTWIRIRVEDNLSQGSLIWLAQPMINVGTKVLPYIPSNIPEPYFMHQTLSDTKLMNGASGSVKVQQLGNTVLVNLIANNVTSNDVVYQLPQNFKPKTLQQASSTESNSEGAYFDFFAIDAQGNISVCQRKFDNSVISKINCNATFSYFLD